MAYLRFNGRQKRRAGITAVGGYVPPKRLTNEILEKMVDTSDEWIVERTGIKERRILVGKPTSYMGVEAVKKLMENADVKPEDIDVVICATVTGDYRHPSTAGVIAAQCGMKNAFCMDVSAACSSFMYALISAFSYVESGFADNVIVIGADKMSSIINYKDRTTCVIFGDGAGAVLVQPVDEYGFVDYFAMCDGSAATLLYQPYGGSHTEISPKNIVMEKHYVHQEGQQVFKLAVSWMQKVIETLMERNNLGVDDIALVIPHQANKRIIDACVKGLGLPYEKVVLNIDRYGNTTSATIPLGLWENMHKLKKGDNVIMVAFGGGLSWGGCYIQWAI